MAGNLNAIFNLEGTRLYTLVAYLGFCSVSGKSPRESLKSTTEVHNDVGVDHSRAWDGHTTRLSVTSGEGDKK